MDREGQGEIRTEQREVATVETEEAALSALLESPPSQQPLAEAQPRGRPWAAGQSGNPAGRPPRIHPPAAVAEYVIARKTIPLAKKMRELALKGDRQMLKLWFQHVAPSRAWGGGLVGAAARRGSGGAARIAGGGDLGRREGRDFLQAGGRPRARRQHGHGDAVSASRAGRFLPARRGRIQRGDGR